MIPFYLGAAVVTIIVGVLVFNRMNGPQSQRGAEIQALQDEPLGPIPTGVFQDHDWLPDFRTADGVKLFTYRSLPQDRTMPRALVFQWHGWNEHSSRNAHVAEKFVAEGYAVFALDNRGQGRSGKTLGLFYNIEDDFVNNALAYVAEVRAMYPETVPCFMYGQSLGGLLCTLVAERSPAGMWAGMIPIAPAIKGNDDLEPAMQYIAEKLGAWVPWLKLKKLPNGLGSRNSNVNDSFFEDDLCYTGKVYAGSGAAIIRGMRFCFDHLDDVTTPFLLIQGTLDKMVNPEGSRQLFDRANVQDKEYRLFEGLWHDVIHEPEWEQVVDEAVEWVNERAGGGGGRVKPHMSRHRVMSFMGDNGEMQTRIEEI